MTSFLVPMQCYIEDFRLMTESVGMQLDDDSLLALFSKVHRARLTMAGRVDACLTHAQLAIIMHPLHVWTTRSRHEFS